MWRAYTYAPGGYGELVAMRSSSASHFYHFDALGSTDRLTDASQDTEVSYLYRGYGEQTVLSGSSDNPFTWLGRMGYYRQSDAGNYWVRARTYQPSVGRFLSLDPARRGLNLYLYVNNRVIVLVDPSGLDIMPGGAEKSCAWIQPPGASRRQGYWCCQCRPHWEGRRTCLIAPPPMQLGGSSLQLVESRDVDCGSGTDMGASCSASFRVSQIRFGGNRIMRDWWKKAGKTGKLVRRRDGSWHCGGGRCHLSWRMHGEKNNTGVITLREKGEEVISLPGWSGFPGCGGESQCLRCLGPVPEGRHHVHSWQEHSRRVWQARIDPEPGAFCASRGDFLIHGGERDWSRGCIVLSINRGHIEDLKQAMDNESCIYPVPIRVRYTHHSAGNCTVDQIPHSCTDGRRECLDIRRPCSRHSCRVGCAPDIFGQPNSQAATMDELECGCGG